MKIFLVLSLFAQAAFGATLDSGSVLPRELSPHGNIVVGSIWENLGWPAQASPKFEPNKDIVIKPTPKPEPVPVPLPKPDPIPSPGPTPVVKKKLSKGQLAIQEMLRKNKEKLNKKNLNEDKEKDKNPSKPKNLREEYLAGLTKLKRENNKTLNSWKEQRSKTLSSWKKKQKDFLKELSGFKEAQFNLEAGDFPVGPSKLKKLVSTPVRDKFYVIPGAMEIPIRNQGKRPTCAAFAGVRAIETLLSAHQKELDLSEQYLYWLAKPDCQQSPCNKRGSWVSKPFKKSTSSRYVDIPLESSCPYSKNDSPNNQTHLPLRSGCQQGSVKVNGFDKVEDLDEVLMALKRNEPVVAGFKLSSNFYENNGLITLMNSRSKGKLDEHANGHAVLLIGYIKLPPALEKRGEGKLCFVTANSWGEGWGQGGYACLTEAWVRQHRIKNAFMALNSAKLK